MNINNPIDEYIKKAELLYSAGKFEESLYFYRQAIEINPYNATLYKCCGVLLSKLGRFDEAIISYKKSIKIDPDYIKGYMNLAGTLYEAGKLEDAEASFRKVIKIKPDDAEAHSHLAAILYEAGKLEDAEASFRQVIKIKPDDAEAHSKLSMVLKDKEDLIAALEHSKKAIKLNPKLSLLHLNMAIIYYATRDINSALESLAKANSIDPNSKKISLILDILQSRKSLEENKAKNYNQSNSKFTNALSSDPLILNRKVEKELITNVYEMNSRKLNNTDTNDARHGNGRCSPDFNLFEDGCFIIKNVAKDLISIIRLAVNSKIFVYDSFFNILGSGGGTIPHRHVSKLDEDKFLNLSVQKYSLVYYLSVGDQSCKEPGILKLYDPDENILPRKGMIVIIPANRKHSAIYDGKDDRVMIGINFYSI